MGYLEYKAALFERLRGHFEVLLEAAVADSRTSISALPLVTAAEAHQLRCEWEEPGADVQAAWLRRLNVTICRMVRP